MKFSGKVAFSLPAVLVLLAVSFGCVSELRTAKPSEAPAKMLWAWEREEDLRFIDPAKTGAAFLAQTLTLDADNVRFEPRRQPLDVPEGTYLIAVTRIESARTGGSVPAYSDEQIRRLTDLTLQTLENENVKGVQTDFDAALSERPFYRRLAESIRSRLPKDRSFTMTALASWCIGDDWLQAMPVDEAVPMAFEMGVDAERVRGFLTRGNDWTEPMCRESYGLSVDEPPIDGLDQERRRYYFGRSSWNRRNTPAH